MVKSVQSLKRRCAISNRDKKQEMVPSNFDQVIVFLYCIFIVCVYFQKKKTKKQKKHHFHTGETITEIIHIIDLIFGFSDFLLVVYFAFKFESCFLKKK